MESAGREGACTLLLRKVAYFVAAFSLDCAATIAAANVAKVLGFRERQMVKTLLFETDKGDHALVMVGADQNAISGLLKKALGSPDISLAKPEVVQRVTGYVIGSIPPFHWHMITEQVM
ncbi:MAG TPA: YbaK/EbsC family protein [Oculatellaceae cyanobacterium]